jgi:hypothetical protein
MTKSCRRSGRGAALWQGRVWASQSPRLSRPQAGRWELSSSEAEIWALEKLDMVGDAVPANQARMPGRRQRVGSAKAGPCRYGLAASMTKRRNLIVPAVLLGIVFLVIAVVYWIEPAS